MENRSKMHIVEKKHWSKDNTGREMKKQGGDGMRDGSGGE